MSFFLAVCTFLFFAQGAAAATQCECIQTNETKTEDYGVQAFPGILDPVECTEKEALEPAPGTSEYYYTNCTINEAPEVPTAGEEQKTDCPALVASLNCEDLNNQNECKLTCTKDPQCAFTKENQCVHLGSLSQSELTEYYFAKQYTATSSIIPQCALQGTCDNINDLLQMLVNYGNLIFGLVGSIALVMFVIGGFMIILSMGNPEKFKKGFGILVTAVVGLMVIFGAYLMVDFLLDAVGVSDNFRAIK